MPPPSNPQLPGPLEAFSALSQWLFFSLPDRRELAAGLLRRCLRLEDLDLLMLQQLRQTELARGCPEAAAVVSAAYTRRMVRFTSGRREEPLSSSSSSYDPLAPCVLIPMIFLLPAR